MSNTQHRGILSGHKNIGRNFLKLKLLPLPLRFPSLCHNSVDNRNTANRFVNQYKTTTILYTTTILIYIIFNINLISDMWQLGHILLNFRSSNFESYKYMVGVYALTQHLLQLFLPRLLTALLLTLCKRKQFFVRRKNSFLKRKEELLISKSCYSNAHFAYGLSSSQRLLTSGNWIFLTVKLSLLILQMISMKSFIALIWTSSTRTKCPA